MSFVMIKVPCSALLYIEPAEFELLQTIISVAYFFIFHLAFIFTIKTVLIRALTSLNRIQNPKIHLIAVDIIRVSGCFLMDTT